MEQAKALAASWARSFMAAALALFMAGVTDPKTLAMAGAAAVARYRVRVGVACRLDGVRVPLDLH